MVNNDTKKNKATEEMQSAEVGVDPKIELEKLRLTVEHERALKDIEASTKRYEADRSVRKVIWGTAAVGIAAAFFPFAQEIANSFFAKHAEEIRIASEFKILGERQKLELEKINKAHKLEIERLSESKTGSSRAFFEQIADEARSDKIGKRIIIAEFFSFLAETKERRDLWTEFREHLYTQQRNWNETRQDQLAIIANPESTNAQKKLAEEKIRQIEQLENPEPRSGKNSIPLLLDSHGEVLLKLNEHHKLLSEPSGLAIDVSTGNLWSVSDDERSIFKIDIQNSIDATSESRTIIFRVPTIKNKDYEGIAALSKNKLIIVAESSNSLMIVDSRSGEVIQSNRLEQMEGFDLVRDEFEKSRENRGLEGVTFNPESGTIFVVKERSPRMLIEISPDLSSIVDRHLLTAERGFYVSGVSDAKLDVSGVAYDVLREKFWIVSDVGRHVFLYDPINKTAKSHELSFYRNGSSMSLRNVEGVAVDIKSNALFVATDDGEDSLLLSYTIFSPEDLLTSNQKP